MNRCVSVVQPDTFHDCLYWLTSFMFITHFLCMGYTQSLKIKSKLIPRRIRELVDILNKHHVTPVMVYLQHICWLKCIYWLEHFKIDVGRFKHKLKETFVRHQRQPVPSFNILPAGAKPIILSLLPRIQLCPKPIRSIFSETSIDEAYRNMTAGSKTLESMPDDIWMKIFTVLDLSSLKNVMQVSQRFHQLANTPTVLLKVYAREYPQPTIPDLSGLIQKIEALLLPQYHPMFMAFLQYLLESQTALLILPDFYRELLKVRTPRNDVDVNTIASPRDLLRQLLGLPAPTAEDRF